MIGVDKIDDIRRLGRGGASIASIARDTGVSEPTVRKYLRESDLPERPPSSGGPRVAPARAVREAGGLVAARGQALLVQAAPHREERPPRPFGQGRTSRRESYICDRQARVATRAFDRQRQDHDGRDPRLFREWFRLGRSVSYRFPLLFSGLRVFQHVCFCKPFPLVDTDGS